MLTHELDIRSFRELWHFLFRKKTCPRCGGKAYRVDTLPKHSHGWERRGLDLEYTYRVKNAVQYRCDPCHAYYSLQELAEKA